MAVSKNKKGEILENLKKIVADSSSIVFVNFHGLPVSQSSDMRKSLRGKNVGYTVAKKSLTRKALSESKIEGTIPEFPGELGIVFGKDMLDPAREVLKVWACFISFYIWRHFFLCIGWPKRNPDGPRPRCSRFF
jgi:large subunit ribosomal protein L10